MITIIEHDAIRNKNIKSQIFHGESVIGRNIIDAKGLCKRICKWCNLMEIRVMSRKGV